MNTLPETQESYTPGYTSNTLNFMARRSAATHAAFALPLFRPGMRILDCGCGPGTITCGLAGKVWPGEVTGIDINAAQLEQARALAVRQGVRAQFMEASIYELPFPAASFDGIFSHALFEHLSRAEEAFGELRRVLKPGGFVALRSPDWGGFVQQPWDSNIAAAIKAYEEMQGTHGGDVHAGRKLPGWMRQAGFQHVIPSASYEIYPDTLAIAEYLAQQLLLKVQDVHAETLRQWARQPGASFAQAWFEAVGWKGW